jgi:rhamnosyl/mannosyltransferase
MKVLHLYKTFSTEIFGGVEKVIDQIARSTGPLGVTSEVLALTREKNESSTEMDGYKVYSVPQLLEIASTPLSFKVFNRFSELVRNTDIIHYHFPWPLVDIIHFAKKVNKPTLITYHSDIVKQKMLSKLYKPLMNRFLRDVDHIVATSPNYVASSVVLGELIDKISVIPIGLVRESYLPPSEERLTYWRNRFKGNFFLFVGALRYYKGLQFLIEAAKGINAQIVIVGAGSPTENDLKMKASSLGVNNVHFLGDVAEEDKIALLTLCYGTVMPSHLRSEAFGISLLEGAMFGKPMISCEIGTGTTYINIDKETGIVVPPSDPSSLQNAFQFLLENPKEAHAMGLQAENRYWSLFTAEKMAISYFEVYENLMRKSPH